MTRLLTLSLVILFGIGAQAMVVQSKILRSRAYSKKMKNGIYAALDMKQKQIKFTKKDLDGCKKTLKRQDRTLKYKCQLWIPNKAQSSILHSVDTPKAIAVKHGQMVKMVKVSVSEDGRSIHFVTEFDNSAVDFDFAEFSSDVFNIFNEAAHQVLAKAIVSRDLKITTLEN